MISGSYLLLTVGMAVQDASANEIGHVTEVVADEVADIFRGVVVSIGLFSHDVFVAGEHVIAVENNRATVDLNRDQLASLPDASAMTVRTAS